MTELQARDRGLYILFVILSIYTVVFSGIGIWRYEHFLFDNSGDQLLFEQVIYNTAHGKPFYNNFSQQNHFGDHNSLMLALLAPVTLLLPAPYVLCIFTVLSVAVASIPIYLLSKEYLCNKTVAFLLAVGFLMLPAFVGQVFVPFHEINLVLPFLTFAFYFFVKERFSEFILMFILSLLVKEDVSLTLLIFAPYAAIKKRGLLWIIIPAILSITWFFLSIKVLIPFFNKNDSYGLALSYFSNMGSSLSELVFNTVSKPYNTFEIMFRQEKLNYIFVLLLPVGLLLPLFSAELVFTFPSLFLNLLAESTRFHLFFINTDSGPVLVPRHMSLMAAVFLFLATICSLSKVCLLFPKISKQVISVSVAVILSLILYNDRFLLSKSLYYNSNQGFNYSNSIKKILANVPKNATVKSNLHIANHLYDRKEAYYPLKTDIKSDYIVVTKQDTYEFDFNDVAFIAYNYKNIARENDISVYKRK